MVKVLVVACVIAFAAWAFASDAKSDHAERQIDRAIDGLAAEDAPVWVDRPAVAGGGAFLLALTVGAIIVIAVNSERRA